MMIQPTDSCIHWISQYHWIVQLVLLNIHWTVVYLLNNPIQPLHSCARLSESTFSFLSFNLHNQWFEYTRVSILQIYQRKRIVKKLMLSMNPQSKSLVSWTKGKNDSIQVGHLEFPPMRSFRPISDETVTSKYFQYTALRVVFGMTSNVNHWLRRFRAMPKNTTLA